MNAGSDHGKEEQFTGSSNLERAVAQKQRVCSAKSDTHTRHDVIYTTIEDRGDCFQAVIHNSHGTAIPWMEHGRHQARTTDFLKQALQRLLQNAWTSAGVETNVSWHRR